MTMNARRGIFISTGACAAGAAYPWFRAVQAYGSPYPDLFDIGSNVAFLLWVGLGLFCATLACRLTAAPIRARLNQQRARSPFSPTAAKANIFADPKRFAAPDPNDEPTPGPDPFGVVRWLTGNAWFAFPLVVALVSPEVRAHRLPLGMYVPLGICLAFLFAYVLIESADLVALRKLASTSRAPIIDEPGALQLFFFVSALGFLPLHALFVEAALEANGTPMGLFIGTGIIWWVPGAVALLPLVLIHGLAESRMPRASREDLKAPLAGLAVGAAVPGFATFVGSGPGTGPFLLAAVIGTLSGAFVYGHIGQGLTIVSSSSHSRRDDHSWDHGHSSRPLNDPNSGDQSGRDVGGYGGGGDSGSGDGGGGGGDGGGSGS